MIRNADVYDLKAIVKLESKIFGQTLGYSFLKQELLENEFSRMYVYIVNDKIVAYISYRQIDNNADILNFLVDIPYQGQGIGKALFEHVLLDMKVSGVKSVILEVRTTNEKAIAFYQRYGAEIITIIPNYYKKIDGYLMYMEVK
ncbi:MAG: ribosomal protein S18-alanine N-acetyltransferase [Acholeplasma sp.]